MLKKVGLVGLLAAAALALPASAATVDELQAQVNALLAQLAGLQGGSSSSAGCYTFTVDLTEGSTGADVTALQNYLASTGHFSVAATGYFGSITRASVASWQAANGVAPAAGYFGAISRAKYNSMCGSTGSTGGSSSGSTGSTGLSGGEADLSDFSLASGDDSSVEEGSDGDVAELEIDVDDADVEVQRVDLLFARSTGTGDQKPWKVFDDITLYFDGDDVASVDGSRSSNWSEIGNTDVYRLRFSGLGVVIEGDETGEFVVNVALQNSVKQAGSASWDMKVARDGIRALDGEGIDHTIGSDDNTMGTGDVVNFDLDEEGDGEDINFKKSSDDPKATTFLVDEDDKSDWFEIFVFNIEADDGGDIDLDRLDVDVTTNGTYSVVVDDIRAIVDGRSFKRDTITNSTSTTATVSFDIDGKVTVDADDMVEVVIEARFKPTGASGANYGSGTTTIKVATNLVEGEGATDVDDNSVISGAQHTLSTAPAAISGTKWETTVNTDSHTGIIDFIFTVGAEEDDVTVLASGIIDTILSGTFNTPGSGEISDSGYGVLTWRSGDDVATTSGGFIVSEGDEATFQVRYTASTTGTYQVRMNAVVGQDVPSANRISPTILP